MKKNVGDVQINNYKINKLKQNKKKQMMNIYNY